MRSSNFFVFQNLYLLNMQNIHIPEKPISLFNFFFIGMNLIPFFKEKLLNLGNLFVLLYILYMIFFFIIYCF